MTFRIKMVTVQLCIPKDREQGSRGEKWEMLRKMGRQEAGVGRGQEVDCESM
jgi:hypothetical protein